MPRPSRKNAPGTFHHIISRGNNREPIFHSDDDRIVYLRMLSTAHRRHAIEVHAYCLMENHIHFLIRSLQGQLSKFMQQLQGNYARYFNWKYSRVGHLFQGRFRSRLAANNEYLLELGRYIHMNPVRGGIVRRPELYRWSSFSAYTCSKLDPIVLTDVLLSMRGLDRNRWARFYDFTVARGGVGQGKCGWPRESRWYAKDDDEVRCPSRTSNAKAEVAKQLLSQVAEEFECSASEILSKWRHPRLGHIRGVIALALREKAGFSLRQVASFMGWQREQTVCGAIARLRARLSSDLRLRESLVHLGFSPQPQLDKLDKD